MPENEMESIITTVRDENLKLLLAFGEWVVSNLEPRPSWRIAAIELPAVAYQAGQCPFLPFVWVGVCVCQAPFGFVWLPI